MPRTTEAEDLLARIEEQERFVQTQEAVVEDQKADLKAATKLFDKAVYDLRKLIRTRDEENPLIDGAEG